MRGRFGQEGRLARAVRNEKFITERAQMEEEEEEEEV